jgi:hypothetical protein
MARGICVVTIIRNKRTTGLIRILHVLLINPSASRIGAIDNKRFTKVLFPQGKTQRCDERLMSVSDFTIDGSTEGPVESRNNKALASVSS